MSCVQASRFLRRYIRRKAKERMIIVITLFCEENLAEEQAEGAA